MNDTVSTVCSDIEDVVTDLRDAQNDDIEDATHALDRAADSLEDLARDLRRMGNALSDARGILS